MASSAVAAATFSLACVSAWAASGVHAQNVRQGLEMVFVEPRQRPATLTCFLSCQCDIEQPDLGIELGDEAGRCLRHYLSSQGAPLKVMHNNHQDVLQSLGRRSFGFEGQTLWR